DVDPMFFSSNAPYDFHLQPGSPCIDAGDNNAIPADITTDLDGQPRFVDDSTIDTGSGIPPLVDMGVFEYHPLFVDASAAGDNNGQTWKDAYNYLQDALHDPCLIYHGQIFIARGTYKPDQDTAGNVTFGSRYESFNLVDGIAIYGGFQNGGCTWQYRNPLGYQTILSGDLAGNDRRDYTLNEENSYHVVYAGRAGSDTILDGLTIYGGNADGDFPFGGGMYNEESSPTVIRCNFIGNSAANFGGGMFSNGGSPLIINNSFFGNSTDSQGGAMFNKYSEPSIINTVFSANTAHYGEGGAIYNQGQDPIITSCSFTANAAHDGGALFNHSGSPTISNTIMWLNTAAEGDQIFNPDNNHYPLIKYCDIQDSYGSGPAWNHNLGTDGGGNIDVDPRFLDADGPDDQTGTADDTLFLSYKSPCIDAGDNGSIPNDTTDLDQDGDTSELIPYDHDYHDRRTDDPPTLDTGSGPLPHIEIGAYERFEFCGDAKHPYPPGDQNQDCIFDLRDFAIIAAWWLQYTGPG
ncbi:MAG: hypothetical protein GY869_20645, partial [Planctomycetes bacterium]|nr:hypothetical protein [Planctomycetota bacterium]